MASGRRPKISPLIHQIASLGAISGCRATVSSDVREPAEPPMIVVLPRPSVSISPARVSACMLDSKSVSNLRSEAPVFGRSQSRTCLPPSASASASSRTPAVSLSNRPPGVRATGSPSPCSSYAMFRPFTFAVGIPLLPFSGLDWPSRRSLGQRPRGSLGVDPVRDPAPEVGERPRPVHGQGADEAPAGIRIDERRPRPFYREIPDDLVAGNALGMADHLELPAVLVGPDVRDRRVRPLVVRVGDVVCDESRLVDRVRPVLDALRRRLLQVMPPRDVAGGEHVLGADRAAELVADDTVVEQQP